MKERTSLSKIIYFHPSYRPIITDNLLLPDFFFYFHRITPLDAVHLATVVGHGHRPVEYAAIGARGRRGPDLLLQGRDERGLPAGRGLHRESDQEVSGRGKGTNRCHRLQAAEVGGKKESFLSGISERMRSR